MVTEPAPKPGNNLSDRSLECAVTGIDHLTYMRKIIIITGATYFNIQKRMLCVTNTVCFSRRSLPVS